jgi:hypothetical protein
MFEVARILAVAALAGVSLTVSALAQDGTPQQSTILGQTKSVQDQAPSLDTLLEQFNAQAPAAPGSVRLDAWVEAHDAGKEVVVMVVPEGQTKLVADPGITVTPAARQGLAWQVPLPHRLVDPGRDYFDPPATVRLPFISDDGQPVELLVEYAYCVIDYQCYFGEEELTVATVVP